MYIYYLTSPIHVQYKFVTVIITFSNFSKTIKEGGGGGTGVP